MRPRTRIALLTALLTAYGALFLVARAVPQHDVVLLVVVLWAALRLGASVPPRHRWLAVFAVALVVLGLNLAWLWEVGFSGRHHVFGGVVALSDAHDYYEDAECALHRLPMTDGRRPLSVAVLAGILRLTNNHIRLALALVVLGWASAVASVTTEVWRTHGRAAAGIVGVVFLLFARRYVGFVQPESLAAPVAAIALCLCWRAASLTSRDPSDRVPGWPVRTVAEQRDWLLAGALLLLTIALFARPGPFTVLLGLLGWGLCVALRRGSKRDGARALALGGAAVGSGWLLQRFVQRTTSPTPSFGDYPAILYGLLHNEEHTYLYQHNAWLSALPRSEQAGAAFALLRDEVLARPSMAPVALARCFVSHLVLPQGLFGFVWNNPDDRVLEDKAVVARVMREHGLLGPVLHWIEQLGAYSFVNAVVMGLLGAAFVVAFVWALARAWKRRRSDPHVELLFFVVVGVALAWPLLPPWITEGAQIHTTVFVAFIALPAVVFFGREASDEERASLPASSSWAALAIPAAFVVLVGLVLVAPIPVPSERACDGPGAFYVAPDRGARIAFGDRPDATIPRRDTDENLERLEKRNGVVASALRAASPRGAAIVPGFDACRGKLYYFVDADDLLARSSARWVPVVGEAHPPAPLVTDVRPPSP